MSLRIFGALAALAAALTLAVTGSAAKKPATRYYLALGDSLSVGFQPAASGAGRETPDGYTNQLYAIARKRIPNLKLVDLGCPGESTTSMLTGKGNDESFRFARRTNER